MPGKFAPRSWDERVAATLRADTTRTVGGQGRNAGPSVSRSRVAASRRGSVAATPTARSSMIDRFDIAGTGTSTFTLTYQPIADSWNVDCSWPLDDTEDYSITGKTLTIVDPAATFIGASGTYPKVLQVQYDYLAAVPVAPAVDPGSIVGNNAADQLNASLPRGYPAGTLAGDLLVLLVASIATINTPSGWTLQGTTAIGTTNFKVFTKVAGAETSVTTTLGTAAWQNGIILTVRAASVAAASVDTATASTTYTSPTGPSWNMACIVHPTAFTPSPLDRTFSGTQSALAIGHTADGTAVTATAATSGLWAAIMLNLVGT